MTQFSAPTGINTRRRHGRMQSANRIGPAPRISRLPGSMSNLLMRCTLATVANSLVGRRRCPVDRIGVFSLHKAIISANWCQARLSTPTTSVVARPAGTWAVPRGRRSRILGRLRGWWSTLSPGSASAQGGVAGGRERQVHLLWRRRHHDR